MATLDGLESITKAARDFNKQLRLHAVTVPRFEPPAMSAALAASALNAKTTTPLTAILDSAGMGQMRSVHSELEKSLKAVKGYENWVNASLPRIESLTRYFDESIAKFAHFERNFAQVGITKAAIADVSNIGFDFGQVRRINAALRGAQDYGVQVKLVKAAISGFPAVTEAAEKMYLSEINAVAEHFADDVASEDMMAAVDEVSSRIQRDGIVAFLTWLAEDNGIRPRAVRFFGSVLVQLLVGLLLLVASNHLSKADCREAVNESIERIRQSAQKDLISELRVVDTSSLYLRMGPSRKTGIITSFPAGTVVRVVEKKKDWTLVEFSDPDFDVQLRGWVFTRYLKKVALR